MRQASIWLILLLAVTASRAAGQAGGRSLAISGKIVDSESGVPLSFAAVTLEAAPIGVVPGASASMRQTRATTSNPAGEYRFDNVSEGDYRLHVQLIGYRARSVDVQVRPASSARVSVGLEINPVELEPVDVRTDPGAAVGSTYARRARELDDILVRSARRLAAERLRQQLYLSGDVRALTHADVTEGLSLGETDLFRALHRVAGVSTADEWSAELWTRGAPWDQTRVYFDGIPLFNALHALGMFSGVNSDAIGAAFLHPGVQPAGLGGAAAGALDIRSRSGSGEGELNGVGELSLVSARLAMDQRSRDAERAWMISARRTYLDLATRALAPVLADDAGIPYAFFDVAARGDLQLAGNRALEVSGLLSLDNARGEIPDVIDNTRAKWGGGVARVTFASPLSGMDVRHTAGYSRYDSRMRPVTTDDPFHIVTLLPADNRLRYYVARGEARPLQPGRWSGGYEVARYTVAFKGEDPTFRTSGSVRDTLEYAAGLNVVAGWLQHRTTLRNVVAADLGLRAEAGSHIGNRAAVALAPRASFRVQIGDQTTASAAAGRSWQYTQALAPSGVAQIKGFASDFIWLLAGDTVPALRSDIVTAGLERWVRDRWIVSANAYARRVNGMTIPDPMPGTLIDRPLFVAARNRAHGIELSLRRLSGRVTGSASYTLSRSTIEAGALEFAAPADQRHTFDATIAYQVARSWMVGAAYTAATGTPYTRRWSSSVACSEAVGCELVGLPRQGEPGALRRNTYQSLDVSVEWTRRYRTWQLSAFLQMRNLLNHANQGRYTGVETTCFSQCSIDPDGTAVGFVDKETFLPGMPAIPLIGVRVGF